MVTLPRSLLIVPALLIAAGAAGAQAQPTDADASVATTADADVAAAAARRWGRLERAALDRALAQRQLVLEPAPAGRRIGQVHVVTLDVFDPGGWMHAFDALHATTRRGVVEASLTVGPGDTWDDELVDEDARRLRHPKLHSIVVLAPVIGAEPGTVDLLVVTRDAWSLRPNTRYELQGGDITYLSVAVAENNLLGTRTHAAVVLEMDQGAIAVGPEVDAPQLGANRLAIRGRARAVLARDGGALEGYDATATVERPLYATSARWAITATASARDAITRVYRGGELRTYDDPETAELEAAPWQFRAGVVEARAAIVRSLGDEPRHDVTAGWQVEATRSALVDDGAGPGGIAAAFRRDVLPPAERTSMPYLGYRLRPTRWRTVRDLATFDVAEDVRVGSWLEADVGPSLPGLGGDAAFWRGRARGGWARVVAGDGVVELGATFDGRRQSGAWVDTLVGASARLASPRGDLGRIVARVEISALLADRHNRDIMVGGDRGLRGFDVGAFWGDTMVLAGAELRSAPLAVGALRAGLVGFAECGGAGDGLDSTRLHHDVGVGLRILIPQLGTELTRIDWAMPLGEPDAGMGRITAGVNHTF